MQKIRLGVIGIGLAWERLHWPALQKLTDRYEIAAVCNKSVEKAQGFADSISLSHDRVYSDYREMLGRNDIDAVDLLVPISENFETARDVLNAGKNLLAEKPFAASPEAARELIALKNSKNLKVMVCENIRYDDEMRIIKEILNSGTIGESVSFIYHTAADFKKDMTDNTFAAKEWRQHPAYEGGVFLDGGIHNIACMRYLFGDAVSLYGSARTQQEEYCPYYAINALLHFKNNVAGQFSFYSSSEELTKPPVGLRIFCTNGEIFLEDRQCGKVMVYSGGKNEEHTFIPGQGYFNELTNFHDALTGGSEIISTPEKELGDIELVFSILRSVKENALVTI